MNTCWFGTKVLIRFVIHLLCIFTDAVIDCRKFAETGCLGYTMAALSSHDEDVRCAALHIIELYQSHLAISRAPEKDQLIYLTELLKDSLPTPKSKLASIITQFLARASALMLKPGR